MDIRKIVENCINDRRLVYYSSSDSLVKKFSIDLILKVIILLINSIGIRNNVGDKVLYFIDEVKNTSMSSSLINTYNKSIESGNKSLLLDYYKFNCTDSHLKIGIVSPFVLIIFVMVMSILALAIDIVTFKSFNLVIKLLVLTQIFYIFLINASIRDKFYLMTDHHFFSSIIANTDEFDTIVLQHGLVLDKRFYYPIRANEFYAWGNRTRDLLDYSSKVKITGTYKFDELIINNNKRVKSENNFITKIMYCVSSLDNEKTINEISMIYNFVKNNKNYELIVKDHPGSLFNQKKYGVNDMNFMVCKEERISDIDFDLAIVGDSTMVLDLAVLNKPFIYFENKSNYFAIYRDLFLCAKDIKELYSCIFNYKSFNYYNMYSELYKNELNNLKCNIFY